MRFARRLGMFVFLFLAGLTFSPRSAAQIFVEPAQLPSRTSFYVLWRGAPTGEIRQQNSLYALWDDPEFSMARAAFLEAFAGDSRNQKSKPAASREEMAQYVTLLDNPILIGYLRRPQARAAAARTQTANTAPAWSGMFLVYDRTGKEELLSRAVLHMRGAEKEIPKLTPMTLASVSALKIERKDGVTYWAEFGKFAVSASEQSVFEEIVNLVNGKPGRGALSQSAAFQEARPLLNGGVIEFFLNISSAVELALDSPNSSPATVRPFLTALKLDSVHSLAGHIAIDGTKTRMRAAILGDTAPGGLFDIWADGQANPVSLSYATPDTVYYSESQFNLLGIYNTLKRAFTSTGNSSSQAANPIEAAIETRLGMPLPDALGLPTGEIAYMQTSPTFDDNQKIYFLGIRNKADTLKLARTLAGDRISSERIEGNTTFLKISQGGGASPAGVAQWNFYYVAVTPAMLLGSPKSETIRKYLGQSTAGSAAAPPKSIFATRGQYPEKLNGFSYFDFQKVDWAGVKAKWVLEANQSAGIAKSPDAEKNGKQFADWLSQVNPEVFPRHLHALAGASWKDAKGVHFEEWVD
jgi:hypothetical protein